MEQHQKNDSGNSLMVGQMLDTFRLPKDFELLVDLSMALQAEGIRYGVEHWRRHPDRVAGIVYWQLNDCWPVASWASLDYFVRWKALHYAARRFFAPLLLSIEDKSPEHGGVCHQRTCGNRGQGKVTLVVGGHSKASVVASGRGTELQAAAQAVDRGLPAWTFPGTSRMTNTSAALVFIAELFKDGGSIASQTASLLRRSSI